MFLPLTANNVGSFYEYNDYPAILAAVEWQYSTILSAVFYDELSCIGRMTEFHKMAPQKPGVIKGKMSHGNAPGIRKQALKKSR